MSDRFKPAEEFLKLSEHEKRLLEESFRLNSNVRVIPVSPPQYKRRQTNAEEVKKIIEERLQNPGKNLAEKELFAGIREFWNSGLNKELSTEQRQNLMFKPDDIDFFKVNAGSKIKELIETDNDVLNRNMNPQSSCDSFEDRKHKGRAMLAKFHWTNQVIQPNFMKESGSMCFTEFWSQKQRSNYFSSVKEEIKSVKVPGINEDQWESVYRPERIRKQQIIKNKINQQTSRMGSGYESAVKPEYKRHSILNSVKPLATTEWVFSSQKKNFAAGSDSQENSPELPKVLNKTSSVLNVESSKPKKKAINTSYKLPTSLEQFSPVFAKEFSSPQYKKPRVETTRGLKQRARATLDSKDIETDHSNSYESIKQFEKPTAATVGDIANKQTNSKLSVKKMLIRSGVLTSRGELNKVSPLRSRTKQVKHLDFSSLDQLQSPVLKNEKDDPASVTNGFR